jgi:hypothetical protein
MRQEKIVLPKFTLPGQTNWVKWVLVGVGGLVAVNMIVLVLVVSKRTGVEATAVAPSAAAEVPAVQASSPPPAAQPKAAVAATASATAVAQPETAAPAAAEAPKAKASARHAHRSRGSSHRALAKAGSTGQRSSSGGTDAVDELLKRFK